MENPRLVCVVHCVAEFRQQPQGIVHFPGPAACPLPKGRSVDEFHGHIGPGPSVVVERAALHETSDAWMIEAPQGLDLPFEARQEGYRHEPGPDDLQCYVRVVLRRILASSAVDEAHATGAQVSEDAPRSDPGRERLGVVRAQQLGNRVVARGRGQEKQGPHLVEQHRVDATTAGKEALPRIGWLIQCLEEDGLDLMEWRPWNGRPPGNEWSRPRAGGYRGTSPLKRNLPRLRKPEAFRRKAVPV